MRQPATCELKMPNADELYGFVCLNAPWATDGMCEPRSRSGRVVICGAGPSLLDHLNVIGGADEVWAANSAVPLLLDGGIRVTHGITVDQDVAMLDASEWGRTFDIEYLVASSVHPKLVRHLKAAKRRVRFFHSYLGLDIPPEWSHPDPTMTWEMFLFRRLYPTSICVGRGLNTVPRAISLAVCMGFSRIEVIGADCAARPDAPPFPVYGDADAYRDWLRQVVLYADGRTADWYGDDAPMCQAEIDGQRWHTRPDMIVSARHMLELQQETPGVIFYHGNTLVNALAGKDQEFMDRLPVLEDGKMSNFLVEA